MTVPLLDPTKLRRQRQIMGLLLGLVLLREGEKYLGGGARKIEI